MKDGRWKMEDERHNGTDMSANLTRRYTAMLNRIRQTILVLIAVVVVSAVGTLKLHADNPVSVYITVRCTATISVELFNRAAGGGLLAKTSYYNFGDVAAASTATAANPIGIRNNSQGAITRWELDVLESGGVIDAGTQWTLGNMPGLNRATLCAKFSSSTITESDFDMARDTVTMTSQSAKTYSLTNFYSPCNQYIEPSYTSDPSRVLPVSYEGAAEGKAERQLWVKLLTPTAVENPGLVTNIMLRVTAK